MIPRFAHVRNGQIVFGLNRIYRLEHYHPQGVIVTLMKQRNGLLLAVKTNVLLTTQEIAKDLGVKTIYFINSF